MINACAAVVFAHLWVLPQESPHPEAEIINAYYFPIQWDTLEAISEETILDQFNVSSLFRREGRRFRNLLDGATGKGHLSPSNVRLAIEFKDGKKILMDKYGNLRSGKKEASLGPDGLKKLRVLLNECLPPPPKETKQLLSLHPLPLGWRVSLPALNVARDSRPIAFEMVTAGNLG